MDWILSMGDTFARSGKAAGKACDDITSNSRAVGALAHDKGVFRIRSAKEARVGILHKRQGLDEARNYLSRCFGFGLSYACLFGERVYVHVRLVCMSLLKFLIFALLQGCGGCFAARIQACEMADKLLTLLNFSRNFLKIYNKSRSGDSFCKNGVAVNESVQGGGMEGRAVLNVWYAFLLVCMLWPFSVMAENPYVGSAACKDCHEEQYENFTKYAKKSHSDRSVKIMASDLTEAELATCYGCHATGFGKPGGFISYEKTPHLADAGCEVCHGPGYDHAESGDAELIKGSLSMEDCVGCHNEDRVKSFNFKPLLYGGAH